MLLFHDVWGLCWEGAEAWGIVWWSAETSAGTVKGSLRGLLPAAWACMRRHLTDLWLQLHSRSCRILKSAATSAPGAWLPQAVPSQGWSMAEILSLSHFWRTQDSHRCPWHLYSQQPCQAFLKTALWASKIPHSLGMGCTEWLPPRDYRMVEGKRIMFSRKTFQKNLVIKVNINSVKSWR